jgi:hypothetical protein
VILAELKIVMAFSSGVTSARVDHIAFYPRVSVRTPSLTAADRAMTHSAR